jgi:hypothetical protein
MHVEIVRRDRQTWFVWAWDGSRILEGGVPVYSAQAAQDQKRILEAKYGMNEQEAARKVS